ncbi:hypothetical protein HDV57DRAFT_486838 [Trichoderma longibrachiatum]
MPAFSLSQVTRSRPTFPLQHRRASPSASPNPSHLAFIMASPAELEYSLYELRDPRHQEIRYLMRHRSSAHRVSKHSAAAELERRRRYSAVGPRDQWPNLAIAENRRRGNCVQYQTRPWFLPPGARRSDGTLVSPPPTPPLPGLSEAELAAWRRKRQLEEMRDWQVFLWGRGWERLGRIDDAHVFVRALPLTGTRNPTASTTSEGPDVPTSSLSSPTSTVPRRLSLRAIVHSGTNPPFGLRREFDLDALRKTIPEPHHLENWSVGARRKFHREEWMSKVQLSSDTRRASWPGAASAPISKDPEAAERKAERMAARMDEPETPVRPRGLQSMGVPMNLDYARTCLPALAAIIMSDRVKRGDMIDLAMPQPEAWPETVAYAYTGSLAFFSNATKENVIYLGGKLGKTRDMWSARRTYGH